MGYNWRQLEMKKIALLIFAIIGVAFAANAQVTGNDIVNALRKADTKENKCYTPDGQEGRLRTTSTTTTTTYSNTQGSSRNSGSRSETNGFGSSISTNPSVSASTSSTYNSGSSSSSNNRTQTTTKTENKTCIPKNKLPLYN